MRIWTCIAIGLMILFCGQIYAGQPFKVLTYNIRYQNQSDGKDIWDNRKETVLKTIHQADLVGLQEVVASQYDYIADNSPGWSWYGVGRSDGLRGGEMAMVGWRTDRFLVVEHGTFWLGEDPFLVGKPAWDAALPRVASWLRLIDRKTMQDSKSPRTLLLVNAHFDHKGALARKNSGSQVRNWIGSHRGTAEAIFVGDLNAKLGSAPLEQLLSGDGSFPALVDARQLSVAKDSGPNSTWNGFSKIEEGNRIDHVLIQGGELKVVNYQTLDPKTEAGRFASDHLPILVEFE